MSEDKTEKDSQSKGFILSPYSKGVYQPDGTLSDPLLSAEAIARWDDENTRLVDGKAWGRGQALRFDDSGKSLTFGRNPELVDVVVDCDPDDMGYLDRELGVSRRHFQLGPPQNDQIPLTDLNSSNGVDIYPIVGGKETLKGNSEPYLLQPGDFVLFGGGQKQEEGGRLIGFRVHQEGNNKPHLIKFTADNVDDLLALKGIVRPTAIEHKNPESVNEGIEEAYDLVAAQLERLHQFSKGDPEYLDASGEAINQLVESSSELGKKHFEGRWDEAAASISNFAREKSEIAAQDEEWQEEALSLEVALLAMKLANTGLIERVKPRPRNDS